jgi:hypothetical protein
MDFVWAKMGLKDISTTHIGHERQSGTIPANFGTAYNQNGVGPLVELEH